MSNRWLSKSSFLFLLASLILAGAQIACARLLSPATGGNAQPTFAPATRVTAPTTSEPPIETPIPPTKPPQATLDRNDFQSVLAWVLIALRQNQPEMIGEVVGNTGAQFWPYAVGGEYLGYNNAGEIVGEVKKGLADSSPRCLGYNPDFGSQPDKAILFFKGINFDWQNLGFEGETSEIVGFQLFRLEQGWELVYITPIPEEFWPDLESGLLACP